MCNENKENKLIDDILDTFEGEKFDGAVAELKIAAENGDDEAQHRLALCYLYGDDIEQDDALAAEWFAKAAAQGNAYAQHDLAMCYYFGTGVARDYAKAFSWFAESAENGDIWAVYRLGICCWEGKGTEQNKSKALEYFMKAAEQGQFQAMYELGCRYEKGEEVVLDLATQRIILRKRRK